MYKLTVARDSEPFNPLTAYDNLGTMYCEHNCYSLGDDDALNRLKLWIDYGTDKEIREIVDAYVSGLSLRDSIRVLNDYTDYRELVECEELEHPDKHFPDAVIALPLYLYDHSGISINCSSFSCSWDSGNIGFIYVTRDTLKKEGLDGGTDEHIEAHLRVEVKIYDAYLTGDMWEYRITDTEGEVIEACGGFLEEDDAEKEGTAIVAGMNEEEEDLQSDYIQML